MKVVYYLASSIDGYIADSDGGVDWLDALPIDHQNTGYEAFYESVDGLMMGRDTYDFVYDYGQWPYDDKPTWVCTSRELSCLEGCNLQTGRDPVTAVNQATALDLNTIWVVGGGVLARSLIDHGLLTHISVSVMPVILGGGRKIFSALPSQVLLEQESSTTMTGFTQVEYKV